ncbi:MAG: Cytosol aminopeptidase PepA [Candidatus Jettenia ecosi]|uniref:Probable cytosol aminopeptidase n=1 Tax=Candidatus Jettenia ecosi TaxID=2494326 RepID=A0A533Q774_9BACT|nr:MAG: Cytosol aminopeptidase PepA [Candidatus Jettenia ecosi]
MNIRIKVGTVEKESAEILAFYLYEDLPIAGDMLTHCDNALHNIVSELIKKKEFVAKLNRTLILPTYGKIPAKRIMLVGLGKKKEVTLDKVRQAAGTTASIVYDTGIGEVTSVIDSIDMPASPEWYQAYTEGCLLALYTFQKYKYILPEEKKELKTITLLLSYKETAKPAQEGIKHGQIIADAVCFTRDLINTPAQDKTPTILANTAKKLAGETGVHCKIVSTPELKKLGMGGILGVSQGSNQPPKLIILEYNIRAKNQDTIIFVGKGITFDSGGICIKPAKDMDQMKSDMSGAAAVMGAMKAISKMRLPQRIIGLIPCTENMPGSSAIKPGDIVKFYSGKTAEVVNTDAEGRLILADALGYAENYKPDAVIDLATLTGSCVVALGTIATGMAGNNEELKKRIRIAGEKSWERVWELPLWDEYQEYIKSDIADIKNTGGPHAGAITAACFLSKFTGKYPWVHLDIAGTSWCDKNTAYTRKGASGVGVRLLIQLIQDWTRFS